MHAAANPTGYARTPAPIPQQWDSPPASNILPYRSRDRSAARGQLRDQRYTEIYDRHLGPLISHFAARDLVRRVAGAVPRRCRVLEIGCGTGISTEHLWRALGPQAEIIATDIDDAMLAHARRHRGRLSKVHYRNADAQALPFDDHAFDAVVCQFGLMFVADKARALSEIARVLRPGGLVAFNVWPDARENPLIGVMRRALGTHIDAPTLDIPASPFGSGVATIIDDLIRGARLETEEVGVVQAIVERPDADDVAQGLIEGNPGLRRLRTSTTNDDSAVVDALAEAIDAAFGPGPVRIPMQAVAYLARNVDTASANYAPAMATRSSRPLSMSSRPPKAFI